MNYLQLTDINEVRGVNHGICHDIIMNAGTYALEFIPTGFQIYALKIILKHCFYFEGSSQKRTCSIENVIKYQCSQ